MNAPKIAAKASTKFDTWSKRPARLCEPAGPVPATPTSQITCGLLAPIAHDLVAHLCTFCQTTEASLLHR